MAANWILDEQFLQTAEAMSARHLDRDHMVLIRSYVPKSCANTGNLIIAQNSIPQAAFSFSAA